MTSAAGRAPGRNALVFMSVNPFPPQSGLHHRCLELAGGLRALGYRVTVASSPWSDPEGWAGGAAENPAWCDEVRLYHPGRWDNRFTRFLVPYGRRRGRLLPLDSAPYVPPRMRRWFSRLTDEVRPDLVVIVHAYWDALVDHRRFAGVPRVIDTNDLVSLNTLMWRHLLPRLPPAPADAAAADPAVLDEGFFEQAGLRPLDEEFRVFERYPVTVAISRADAAEIARNTRRTRVELLPITFTPPRGCDNRYDGPALFATGPNPFNVQAYLYFVARVLPLVLQREPGFRLRVTGYCDASRVAPAPGVELSGWVDDLAAAHAAARFSICPVFGGTGQQVKIVEAMANGLAVVALRAPAERSPLEHGVSGLVAGDAAEFADHVVRLWRDPVLCRTMGEAARETIRREFSRDAFTAGLARVVEAAQARAGVS